MLLLIKLFGSVSDSVHPIRMAATRLPVPGTEGKNTGGAAILPA